MLGLEEWGESGDGGSAHLQSQEQEPIRSCDTHPTHPCCLLPSCIRTCLSQETSLTSAQHLSSPPLGLSSVYPPTYFSDLIFYHFPLPLSISAQWPLPTPHFMAFHQPFLQLSIHFPHVFTWLILQPLQVLPQSHHLDEASCFSHLPTLPIPLLVFPS